MRRRFFCVVSGIAFCSRLRIRFLPAPTRRCSKFSCVSFDLPATARVLLGWVVVGLQEMARCVCNTTPVIKRQATMQASLRPPVFYSLSASQTGHFFLTFEAASVRFGGYLILVKFWRLSTCLSKCIPQSEQSYRLRKVILSNRLLSRSHISTSLTNGYSKQQTILSRQQPLHSGFSAVNLPATGKDTFSNAHREPPVLDEHH